MGKAYIATEPNESQSGVLFVNHAIEARRWWADEHRGGELSGITVHRAKGLDQYEGVGVPAYVLVESGWWFECHGCGMIINEESLDERDLRSSAVSRARCGGFHG